ncbi:MAG: hypothetical protein AAGG48_09725 [Planctomycetota bacterium]
MTRRFRQTSKPGDIITIHWTGGTDVHCVNVFASTTYKDLILLAVPRLIDGVFAFGDEGVKRDNIQGLIYTSSSVLQTEHWENSGTQKLFDDYRWLSLRTIARELWLEDELGQEVPRDFRGRYGYVREMDCAGYGLVDETLSFLRDGSEESKYTKTLAQRSTEFLKRFDTLSEIWEQFSSQDG